MELGLVRKVDIDSEMQQSYLDYAMSVIVARALPDARDGLKPVQRRVLYAMYDMNLRPESGYKKSARIVGEVLGKYHPHGDVAVYESMARLAQDFTMRYTLVDGQGNFGSVDGDPPAAMRYTEARLSAFAVEMLAQLDRDTVDFSPNFDGTLSEPDVLPAAAPGLLVNGASGIAVGMATNIPPHNLGEVVDALVLLLHEWDRLDDLPISELMKHIKGPDFPTGGIILQESGQNDLLQAYGSGRGRVIVRGRVQKEDMERGKSRLIISELPYQVNKSALIERIAELVREGDLEGIADLRDESDRQGMRIVIELKAGLEAEPVLRELYKRTPLESTIGINLLALVEGEPRLLTLKQALRVYLEHRLVVIKRRSEHDLARAKARAHILEGLRIALSNLDAIIALIKASPDAEQARERLIRQFKLTEIQAQAILDMQLRRLAALERKKIEQEYKELTALIKELEGLIKSPRRMRQVVEEELLLVKERFADKRRTQIVFLKEGESARELLTTSDMTPAQTAWVGIMEDGTIGRNHDDAPPRLSGRAAPRWLLRATSHHTLYLVGEDGRAAAVAIESLPEVDKFTEGVQLNKVSPFESDAVLVSAFVLPPRGETNSDAFVMSVTRLGMVKKTGIEELPGPSTQRFTLARINPGDAMGWTFLTRGSDDVLMVTTQGMAIRFSEQEVRPMGLVAAGVNGIKLAASDRVVGAERLYPAAEVLAVASNGKAWRLEAEEFPVQGRYGQGVQMCKPDAKLRLVGVLVGKRTHSGIIHYRVAAAKAVRIDEIPPTRRLRAGQDLAAVKTGDAVIAVTPVIDGLAFWAKPGAVAKKRSKKDGNGDLPEPIVEIVEEKQFQAALPGFGEPEPATPPAAVLTPKKIEPAAQKPVRKPGNGAGDHQATPAQPERLPPVKSAKAFPDQKKVRGEKPAVSLELPSQPVPKIEPAPDQGKKAPSVSAPPRKSAHPPASEASSPPIPQQTPRRGRPKKAPVLPVMEKSPPPAQPPASAGRRKAQSAGASADVEKKASFPQESPPKVSQPRGKPRRQAPTVKSGNSQSVEARGWEQLEAPANVVKLPEEKARRKKPGSSSSQSEKKSQAGSKPAARKKKSEG